MAYGDFKNLNRRTVPDKILRGKVFNVVKNSKYDGYQMGLASMVCDFFFIKRLLGKNENVPNKELAEELNRPVMIKFKKGKCNPLL